MYVHGIVKNFVMHRDSSHYYFPWIFAMDKALERGCYPSHGPSWVYGNVEPRIFGLTFLNEKIVVAVIQTGNY